MQDKPYFKYWGKARKEGEEGAPYHLLPYHCLDVAAVGEVLLSENPYFVETLERATQIPAKQLKPWLLFILSLHDIGKFSEVFQQMKLEHREAWWGEVKFALYDVRHDSLGFILWEDDKEGLYASYQKDFGVFGEGRFRKLYRKLFSPYLQAVCGHHGSPPYCAALGRRVNNNFRDFDVLAAREFVDAMEAHFQPEIDSFFTMLSDKAWCKQQEKASWLIAGFTVLCDWLGSNNHIFDYCDEEMEIDKYWNKFALPKAKQAVQSAGVLPATSAKFKPLTVLFKKINQPTPLQQTCESMEFNNTPQLFILEDVTGAGKTEAAITLVHRLMSKNQAQGVFVALPTMATANAMYDRMAEVYRALYADNETPSLVLSHSARHLSDLFQKSILNSVQVDGNYSTEDETASVQCARWLAEHRKKALLADVSIGTVDQALLGILPAKHQSLRLYGLSNKVLLVDEVHAYDHYMFPLLKTLIQFHSYFGGSVVLLSATLPMHMRQELINAFNKGRGQSNQAINSEAYPLLTHIQEGCTPQEIPLDTRQEVERTVTVEMLHQESDALEVIKQAVEKGRCVCWVRNTVHDARQAYGQLQNESWTDKGKLDLFHSRYALGDRLAREKEVLVNFGDDSTEKERRGRVLIATQVIEQSLDMDADVMISDLAPIDLLIQRAGRLHRHVRDAKGNRNRSKNASDERTGPVIYVLSPSLEQAPEQDWYKSLFPKGVYVYPHTGMLWNTARLLSNKKGWTMPADARSLIEGVYGHKAEEVPETLQKASEEAEGEWWANKSLADFNTLNLGAGYAQDNAWDDEAKIPTRLAEDSVTLYLAQWDGEHLTPLIDQGRYPWDLSSTNVAAKKVKGIPQDHPAYQAVQSLKEEVSLFNEFSVVVPMSWQGDKWVSVLQTDENNFAEVSYSSRGGFVGV